MLIVFIIINFCFLDKNKKFITVDLTVIFVDIQNVVVQKSNG